ncbi:MAG: 4-aminobutyrate aminotransferase [Frankiales bacterium]|nr:4-aminobutyrate aminotransferase [Frankiales bacterium]
MTTSGTAFDFFTAGALPAPVVSAAEAEAIAADRLGRPVRARSLGSQQDANFVLTAPDGAVAGVLKISNAAFGATEIDAQDAAAEHLATRVPGLRVATPVPLQPGSGADSEAGNRALTLASGARVVARVLRYLPGSTLSGSGHLAPRTVAALGDLAGRVAVGLAEFSHPGLRRVLQWDLRQARRVVSLLAPEVADAALRARVEEAAGAAWGRVQRVAAELPVQAVHGDLTDDNVVCAEIGGARVPDGVIDLGDLTESWAVGELAVAVSSLLHHDGATAVSVLPAVTAYAGRRPLSEAEVEALWPLVVLRGAVLVVSGLQQAVLDPGNPYVSGNLEHEQRIFDVATSVPPAVITALVRRSLGMPVPAAELPAGAGMLGEALATGGRLEVLDLTATADALDAGAWLRPDIEEELAVEALDAGAALVVTAFGEARLTRAVPLSAAPPENVATGVDAWWAREATLRAPWHGTSQDGGRRLRGNGVELTIGAVAAEPRVGDGGPVRPGDPLVTVPARTRVRVTVRATGDAAVEEVPAFVEARMARGWLTTVADPSALLGAPPRADGAGGGDLLARRDAAFATLQGHYYAAPPRIERGWREHLVDTDGRVYLDTVNNVAVLGHGHPGMADAVAGQLRRLNTNSRFHYSSVVEFSERLAALLPEPLDTVFLVNSGSEADDLALRIALATTGRRDVVAVGEAYHGWTYATDAVSTSEADNPGATGTRPGWVHTLDAPNTYRGRHRGDDARRYAVEAVARVDALVRGGRAPAAFIAEPVYGNAGGLFLPDGYLAAVYAAVRGHGGLAIADEVQVGYGRLGEWFWGFEQQGVVPDIVTVAKAMGNGHPLGAVVTSRRIAEAYRNQGYFFSSAGGSPVSSVVGLTVLDAIRDEGLQENARVVGDHLRRRLQELAVRHPLIGAVHGRGLYLGVELVRDRATREPATEETAAICDRLLELGVVAQPTSDRMCVLKVKPPLCMTRESADFFVDALDRVLSRGW